MLKRIGVGVLLVFAGAASLQGRAALALDNDVLQAERLDARHHNEGPKIHIDAVSQKAMQCDRMQDYEYYIDEDGNEVVIGNIGDPYLTNCVEIGGSSGGDGQCEGQDPSCLCHLHPATCGGDEPPPPEDGPQCVCDAPTPGPTMPGGGANATAGDTAAAPTDDDLFAVKPADPCKAQGATCHTKQTCADCNSKKDKDVRKLTVDKGNCQNIYRQIAGEECKQNNWRSGDPRPRFGNPDDNDIADDWTSVRGSPLTPQNCHVHYTDAPGPHGTERHIRHIVCVPNPDFAKCQDSWMETYPGHQTSTNGGFWGTQITSISIGGKVSVSFGGTTTEVTLPPEAGYKAACEAASTNAQSKIVADFATCADKATHDEGHQCKATAPH